MGTHVVMKKSLAKALMDAGVEHFDAGGPVGTGSTKAGGLGGFVSGLFGGQSDYQAQAPTITTQNLLPRISTLQNRNDSIYGQQQGLARALLAQSQGQGPNPARARLNETTGNNIAGTAALMAGVRGVNANPGLIAQLAARQGAATQQQAVGQGATLEAEQELASQKALQDLYAQETGNALQGESILQGAQAAQNSAETTGQLGAAETNAQIATANSSNASHTGGGILGAVGSVLGSIFYEGGEVASPKDSLNKALTRRRYADGGIASYAAPTDPRVVLNVPSSGDIEKNLTDFGSGLGSALTSGSDAVSAPEAEFPGPSLGVDTSLPIPTASGIPGVMGTVPGIPELMPSGGGAGLISSRLPGLARGGSVRRGTGSGYGGETDLVPLILAADGGEIDFRAGGNVPGKAGVQGDSPKNDTVPALLSPGEEVLPRSVTMAPDAPERAKAFVEALRDRKGEGRGYGRVLRAKASLKDRVAHLEKLCAGGVA